MRITVEKLIHGGLALGRLHNKVVFIEGALPHEEVRIQIVSSIKQIPLAVCSSIEIASPHRTTPRCQHFSQCGGCDWQHIDYAYQVTNKALILKDCFKRIAKISELPPFDIFESHPWQYRIRAQFHVASRNHAIGFYKKKSHTIVPLDYCPLLHSDLNNVLLQSAHFFPSIPSQCSTIKTICGHNGVIASDPLLSSNTAPQTTIQVGNFWFTVSAKSFFQNNLFLFEKLSSWVSEACIGGRGVDLYGGVGFFAVHTAHRFDTIYSIDAVQEQTTMAQNNFLNNSINNGKALCATAENYLRSIASKNCDCLIVDPPRGGLTNNVLSAICQIKPRILIYISCDPATLCRDTAYLVQHAHYTLEKCALFDLYPHTHHMEMVTVFKQ